ncbi:hypothetical protein Gotur_031905 [Gossypium turneri]
MYTYQVHISNIDQIGLYPYPMKKMRSLLMVSLRIILI